MELQVVGQIHFLENTCIIYLDKMYMFASSNNKFVKVACPFFHFSSIYSKFKDDYSQISWQLLSFHFVVGPC